jgi:hypothetical protein
MGGSGGGGGGGGGGGTDDRRGRPRPDACNLLAFETLLQSPDLTVLAQIQVGDVLTLEVRQIGGAHTVLVLHNGNVAGTIMSQNANTLLGCMLQGHGYKATVKTIAPPTCQVSIAHI